MLDFKIHLPHYHNNEGLIINMSYHSYWLSLNEIRIIISLKVEIQYARK
jgi:competence transcription factor ComK